MNRIADIMNNSIHLNDQNEQEPTYTVVHLAADKTNQKNPYTASLEALKEHMGDRGTVIGPVINNYTGEMRPGVFRVELHDMSLNLSGR